MDEGSRRALVSRTTTSPNGASTCVVRRTPGNGKTTVLRQVSDAFVRQGRWVGWNGANDHATRRPFRVVDDGHGIEPQASSVFRASGRGKRSAAAACHRARSSRRGAGSRGRDTGFPGFERSSTYLG